MILNKKKFKFNFPMVMGICNVTKNSFSDGGQSYTTSDALKNIKKMLNHGATIIDIGAESTRPGSDPISYQQEIKKLEPILKKIPKDKFIISIDSNKIETQEFALKHGAHIINDIFGGSDEFYSTSTAETHEIRFDFTSQITNRWRTRFGVDYKTHRLNFYEIKKPWEGSSANRQRFAERWDD